MGPRSSALAGTGAADADGYDAVYENPAGLVEPTRRRLTLGFVAARYQVDMDGSRRDVESTNGAILGADIPLPFGGVLKDRIALGLGFYLPTTVLNRASAPFPDQPRLALLDERTQVVSAMAALSVRLHERVSVGAGVLVLATLIGQIKIQPDNGGRITTLAEEQIVVNYAPIIGVRVRVSPSLRLGAVFRGESKAQYDIAINSSLGSAIPLQLPVLHIAGVAQYDPMQGALEASWHPRPFLTLIGGATWKHWSAFPLPTENASLGTPAQPPPNYHDTVVPRAAMEIGRGFGPLRLVGRAGYFFEWSPAPRNAATLLDADRHVFTAGAGAEWTHRYGTLQLDVFGQFHELADAPRVSGSFYVLGLALGMDL